jgi:hypothetical protein
VAALTAHPQSITVEMDLGSDQQCDSEVGRVNANRFKDGNDFGLPETIHETLHEFCFSQRYVLAGIVDSARRVINVCSTRQAW